MDHTDWRCPKCNKRFSTWGDEEAISPCCKVEIPKETLDNLEKAMEEMRKKLLADKDS